MKEQITALALKLVGCPYIWGGANPWTGFDCSGFVIWIYQVFGILPSGDWTADGLYREFTKRAAEGESERDMSKPLWIRLFAWGAWLALLASVPTFAWIGYGHHSVPLSLLGLGLLLAFPALLILWGVLSLWWKATVSSAIARVAANRGSGPPSPPIRPPAPYDPQRVEYVAIPPGPLCGMCRAHFAITECGTHRIKLCLACWSEHDAPSQCFYFPLSRAERGKSEEGETNHATQGNPAPGAARKG